MKHFNLGDICNHKTLGLVKIVKQDLEEHQYFVEILQNPKTRLWKDDWGYDCYTDKGTVWWVKGSNLSLRKAFSKEDIIKERIHKLWNESNYVKRFPNQAYITEVTL